jgi:ribulose-phosphate 3-epimerase
MTRSPGPATVAALPRDRLLAEFSLWSADLANLEGELKRADPHVDLYHVDVADGRFAPSFLFFPDQVARIRALTARPIHVHLMVEADIVEDQARQFVEAGADLVSVHAENGEAGFRAARLVRALGAEAGVVLRLETPVEAFRPFLAEVGFATLLGTAIGVKGQGLSDDACLRLGAARRSLREAGREGAIRLAADGGIRHETVPRLRAAGAETVVMGSLAFADADLPGRIRWLHGLPAAVA